MPLIITVFYDAGIIRGTRHYKENHEAFCMIGGLREVSFAKGMQEEVLAFLFGRFSHIAPYASHESRFLRDTIMSGIHDLEIEKSRRKNIIADDSNECH